jgi:cytochrome b subunit of formate dehydrogenase
LLVLHVSKALIRAVRNRRLPIMFATRKDFVDTLQTVRQFLGLAPAPRVGKFDFRAKFEYWGLLMGGTLMSATGFMLLFPETFSWIVPGGVIAAGRVLHGLEGTFAVLVVILWHSWSVILRPEIFPLDKSIFTGKIDLERLREEHVLEYERIFGTQDPDEVDTPKTPPANT